MKHNPSFLFQARFPKQAFSHNGMNCCSDYILLFSAYFFLPMSAPKSPHLVLCRWVFKCVFKLIPGVTGSNLSRADWSDSVSLLFNLVSGFLSQTAGKKEEHHFLRLILTFCLPTLAYNPNLKLKKLVKTF